MAELPPPPTLRSATATANASVFATFPDGASVPASQVANQVGAFATQNRAAPRPALAPADPAVIEKLKSWAIEALGGGQLKLPSSETGVVVETSNRKGGELAASPFLEMYVRQMACRKPDCVPLETVFMLLGNGWHEKTEVLKAAKEVTQADVNSAAQLLWDSAKQKHSQAAPPEGRDDGAGGGGRGDNPQSLAEVEADLFTKKTVESVAGSETSDPAASGGEGKLVSGSKDLPVVLPRDITEYSFSSEEVYVVGTNGRKVTVIAGLEHLAPTLKELVLRSHVISRMEGIRTLVHLTKLELYDNAIEELEELEFLPQLEILDMSYNSIRSMAPVQHCPLLEEIYLAQNKLRTVEGLESLSRLRKIDIGGNRIRDLSGVSECTALEELWAGKNKVESLGGCLSKLTKLKRLDVQSNRLVSVEGLVTAAQSHTLEELYLARNGIASLVVEEHNKAEAGDVAGNAVDQPPQPRAFAPFGLLQVLNTVDISNNRLTSLDGLGQCSSLEEVWASANLIDDLTRGVRDLVATSVESPSFSLPPPICKAITCVYLEHNPCAVALGDAEYRRQLKDLLPGLTQIDATSV